MSQPIPSHLARFDWYAPHQAWLREQGYTPRHDPGDAKPQRANLSGAKLTGENLTEANLSGANLSGANLSGANLSGANLTVADLSHANLIGATLYGATLYGVIGAIFGFIGRYQWCGYRWQGKVYLSFGCETLPAKEWPRKAAALALDHERDRRAEFTKITKALAKYVQVTMDAIYPVETRKGKK